MRYPLKIVLYICLSCLIIYVLAIILFGYPVVLDIPSKTKQNPITYFKGQTIKPFNGFEFDFNSDDWTAYLLLSAEDYKLLENKLPGRKLVTKNHRILSRLKQLCVFTYTDGDLSTVTSRFILYKNGAKVFETGIVLEGSIQGFQNQNYGWIVGRHDLISVLKEFDRIKMPIVILK